MIKISIIEDNIIYTEFLKKSLQDQIGVQLVSTFVSAEDAFDELIAANPDIILIDIELPGISGIELIQKLKPLLNSTKFLVLSSHSDDVNIFKALHAGASGYVLKESNPEQIRDAVKGLSKGGAPLSPSVSKAIISHYFGNHQKEQEGLSMREIEVIKLLSDGLIYKEIADKLNISAYTVKNHLKKIYKKLGVQNKVEALQKFTHKK